MGKTNVVLLTGGAGLLGVALLADPPSNFSIVPTYFNNPIKQLGQYTFIKLNIVNPAAVTKVFLSVKPTVIIHAASIGNVDYCEKNPDEAYQINVVGTKNIVRACEEHGVKLIFLSSNAVFDGLSAPYNETSKVNPVNYYGKTKVLAEELILKRQLEHAIVRLILMYGWNHPTQRQNPVTWLLDKLMASEPIKMVNDTYTNPVFNNQAAQTIWRLIKQDKSGLYHVAGKRRVNRYDFAVQTAKTFGYDPGLIEPVGSDYFAGIATRMPDTTYDTAKMEKELGVSPLDIADGLVAMKSNPPVFDGLNLQAKVSL